MINPLFECLKDLRATCESAFSPDTCAGNMPVGAPPSAGHCALVAMFVRERCGGGFASAIVNGASHWFNRLERDGLWVDVDLTGDQFGRPPIQIERIGTLFAESRDRSVSELNAETWARFDIFRRRLERLP